MHWVIRLSSKRGIVLSDHCVSVVLSLLLVFVPLSFPFLPSKVSCVKELFNEMNRIEVNIKTMRTVSRGHSSRSSKLWLLQLYLPRLCREQSSFLHL